MALVKMKPTSPGRRHQVRVVNKELHTGKPHKALLESQSKSGGRNNNGRITTRHIGGGHKRAYRIIDFKRRKFDVEATIDDTKYDMFDLFSSTFTAGTMTGAPKIRAMELIADFEQLKRSFYSGSIVYFGFDGNMDSAITIRTTMLTDDTVIFQAGAGVVADSKPEDEYQESLDKAAALRKVLCNIE